MPGYSTNVAITESGIYLRVGLKNKFINSKTCLEKIMELKGSFRNGEYMRKVTDFFKNYSVMTIYGTHKVYKIENVAFDSNVRNKNIIHKDKDGIVSEITLEKYYKDQYQRVIKAPDQPLLVSYVKNSRRENEPIYLVPELCYLTGMDEDMRSMDDLKKSMTNRTKLNPEERMDKIFDIKSMLYNQNSNKKTRIIKSTGEVTNLPDPNEIRQQWGVNIIDFKQFNGRELKSPKIRFKTEWSEINNGIFKAYALLDPIDLDTKSWSIVCSQNNRAAADAILTKFKIACVQIGVKVEIPRIYYIRGRNDEEWVDYLGSMDFNNGLKIILIILDKKSKNYWSSIKKFVYTQIGLPIQVVLAENSSKIITYFANVLKQMVAKMGGLLYDIPSLAKEDVIFHIIVFLDYDNWI